MMIPNTSTRFLLFFICTTFICLSSSSSFPTQYSIMGPNLDRLPSPDQAIELFLQWVREHGKVYKNLDELGKKFEIFLDNLKYISESNAARSASSYRLGLNGFADWSRKEFEEVYLHEYQLPTEHRPIKLETVSYTASSLDWRQKGVVTPVKYQKRCGSCWAFSAAGAIEGTNAIETGSLISISEQELLDCAENLGCLVGGWVTKAYDWVVANGIASEASYPYTGVVGTCRASQVPRSPSTIRSYSAYLQRTDNTLLSATMTRPISVLVDASDFQFYHSGIYDGPNCNKTSTFVNHGMLIVGFDSQGGQDYWIVKNSWDTIWGIGGYMWIKRNTGLPFGVCAINAWASYPIRVSAASSDQSVSSM